MSKREGRRRPSRRCSGGRRRWRRQHELPRPAAACGGSPTRYPHTHTHTHTHTLQHEVVSRKRREKRNEGGEKRGRRGRRPNQPRASPHGQQQGDDEAHRGTRPAARRQQSGARSTDSLTHGMRLRATQAERGHREAQAGGGRPREGARATQGEGGRRKEGHSRAQWHSSTRGTQWRTVAQRYTVAQWHRGPEWRAH